ncbi:MAG TPA: tail fiber domain-containing protein [Xanthobacteraceae bacterium]
MSESKDERTNDALAGIDAAKRETLNRLITGTAFVAPIVASFAMDGLTISKAQAETANGSGIVRVLSDRRLKTGIARVATLASGLGLYRFKYLWSAVEYVGVMAQEVRDLVPAAVVEGADGFMRVDYRMLGLEMLTYRAWQARNPQIAAA